MAGSLGLARLALAALLLPAALGGCTRAPWSGEAGVCHGSDWLGVNLRSEVADAAVRDAFEAEGWTLAPGDGRTFLGAVWADRPDGMSLLLQGEASRASARDANGTVSWEYLHVSLSLAASADGPRLPVPQVEDVAAPLVARLRALGEEERSPSPWPTGGSSDWSCAE